MSNRDRAIYWWRWSIDRNEPHCGYGSTFESTRVVVAFIESVIREFKVQSIADCGCGEYALWMNTVKKTGALYRGYDINGDLIRVNQLMNPGVYFEELDITETPPARSDLVICRDCLFHLPTDRAVMALNNFRSAGCRWLISTTFPDLRINRDLDNYIDGPEMGYGYRPVNLIRAPYSLGDPIWFVDEVQFQRQVGLWRLND